MTRHIHILLLAAFLSLASFSMNAAEPSAFMRHFTWGAEAGGSIDMSGHSQSTVDINAAFGYRDNYIRLLGIGAGLDMMVSNSNRSFPVYGILRTSFTSRPSMCFVDLRAGVAINCLEETYTQAGAFLSGGIGFRLAYGATYSSHLILSYNFIERKPLDFQNERIALGNLSMVSLRIGVSF